MTKLNEMAEAYTAQQFGDNADGFHVAPWVNSDTLSDAFLAGAQAVLELDEGWCLIVSDSHVERQIFRYPSPPGVIPADQILAATIRVWTKEGRKNPHAIYLVEVPEAFRKMREVVEWVPSGYAFKEKYECEKNFAEPAISFIRQSAYDKLQQELSSARRELEGSESALKAVQFHYKNLHEEFAEVCFKLSQAENAHEHSLRIIGDERNKSQELLSALEEAKSGDIFTLKFANSFLQTQLAQLIQERDECIIAHDKHVDTIKNHSALLSEGADALEISTKALEDAIDIIHAEFCGGDGHHPNCQKVRGAIEKHNSGKGG